MLHGGEVYNDIKIEYDFSVNINPLGIPEPVLEALRDSLPLLTQYPDRDCSELRSAIAKNMGIPAQQILCGNGASELIEAAVRAISPRNILLTAPCFSGYRHAAEGFGAEICWHMLRREDDFALTERYLEDLARGPDMAILCSPANPIGNLIPPALLRQIVEICERRGTWLMVDECFLGFIPDEDRRTMRRLLVQAREQAPERLLVLDALTKRYAMPGIRLGWLMAKDPSVLEKIKARQPEWSVSLPAQTAGIAALGIDSSYMERTRALVAAEREKMVAALKKFGFRVFPGEADFIFFSTEKELFEPLLSRGFLIRSCDNYVGLRKGDFRIAILLPEENARLLQAMEEIIRL